MNRRSFLALAGLPVWSGAAGAADPDRRLGFFRLQETAGLRRFGYPVHIRLPDEGTLLGVPVSRFRLERHGRVIPAQFHRGRQADGRSVIAVDFNASPGPFAVEIYTLHDDARSQPGRAAGRGMGVQRGVTILSVANPPHIAYTLDDHLKGLVRSVQVPGLEFLAGFSRGLFVARRDRAPHLLFDHSDPGQPDSVVEVTRPGPLAVGLRWRGTIVLPAAPPLRSIAELTFPSSKSWIEMTWTIDDPRDQVEGMGVDLVLQLEGQPALWDCGASSTVYGTLRGDERMTFEAGGLPSRSGNGPHWVIRHGTAEKLQDLASARTVDPIPPEGWVHVMDRRRCTAMAVADFGRLGPAILDRFEVHAGGHLVFEREFLHGKTGQTAAQEPKKTLRFWLHFVPAPVQVGAVTSPQSMLAPLQIEWMAAGTPQPKEGR
jgi:hypothetical protein